jgi:hypothetical protein
MNLHSCSPLLEGVTTKLTFSLLPSSSLFSLIAASTHLFCHLVSSSVTMSLDIIPRRKRNGTFGFTAPSGLDDLPVLGPSKPTFTDCRISDPHTPALCLNTLGKRQVVNLARRYDHLVHLRSYELDECASLGTPITSKAPAVLSWAVAAYIRDQKLFSNGACANGVSPTHTRKESTKCFAPSKLAHGFTAADLQVEAEVRADGTDSLASSGESIAVPTTPPVRWGSKFDFEAPDIFLSAADKDDDPKLRARHRTSFFV